MVVRLPKGVKKTLVGLATAGQLLLPSALLATQEIEINPFLRPLVSLNFYGSGDVDGDHDTDLDDYNLVSTDEARSKIAAINPEMVARADVIPDEILDNKDAQAILGIVEDPYNFETRDGWNELTREQRENLVRDYLAIDKTDEHRWVRDTWDCSEFAEQLTTNFMGWPSRTDFPDELDSTNAGKFNTAVYWMGVSNPDTASHSLNAVLVGNNPLKWNHWMKIEPQTDEIVDIGQDAIINYMITGKTTRIGIELYSNDKRSAIIWFYPNPDGSIPDAEIDSRIEPYLVKSRPDVLTAIVQNDSALPERANIGNHPNPFNPNTTISYGIAETGEYSLNIYSSTGQLVRTLADHEYRDVGSYEVSWDGRNSQGEEVGSGVYVSELVGKTKTNDLERMVGKMTLVR